MALTQMTLTFTYLSFDFLKRSPILGTRNQNGKIYQDGHIKYQMAIKSTTMAIKIANDNTKTPIFPQGMPKYTRIGMNKIYVPSGNPDTASVYRGEYNFRWLLSNPRTPQNCSCINNSVNSIPNNSHKTYPNVKLFHKHVAAPDLK
jgi:hypothetical protein